MSLSNVGNDLQKGLYTLARYELIVEKEKNKRNKEYCEDLIYIINSALDNKTKLKKKDYNKLLDKIIKYA